jgi:hypothetical protein
VKDIRAAASEWSMVSSMLPPTPWNDFKNPVTLQ